MSVSLVRRSALLLVILATTCRPFTNPPPPPAPAADVFCTTGNGSESRPMICVDDNLLANPRSARVYDVEADNQRPPQPSNKPVVIHWFAQHSVNLQISWTDTSCADKIDCDGSGECKAKIKIKLKKGETKRCTYGVSLGNSKLDPEGDIVVNPCCL